MLGTGQGPDPGDWTYTVAESQEEKTANMASSKRKMILILNPTTFCSLSLELLSDLQQFSCTYNPIVQLKWKPEYIDKKANVFLESFV